MRGRNVDQKKLRDVKERAIRYRQDVLTYIPGTFIKHILEDLGLWEDEPPEEGDGGDD